MGIRVNTSGEGATPAGSPRARREDDAEDVAATDLAGWLRHLTWALGPVAPGTTLAPAGPVRVAVGAGDARCLVRLEIVNEQRAAVVVSLEPGVLRGDDGRRWLPHVLARGAAVLPPGAARIVHLELAVPSALPAGSYRGALVALGVGGHVPLEVTVGVTS